MNQFLETLKSRLSEAQKRFDAAQKALQKAQAEFQVAAQEQVIWQNTVQFETRKQQEKSGAPAGLPAAVTIPTDQAEASSNANNRTEAVRQLLRQHPTGITPSDLWRKLDGQITHRPYLYSILKRLRDRDEANVRRGKYFLRVPQEGKDQTLGQ
jgi:hypothetical protein